MKIIRKDLILKTEGEIASEGSANVKITLENDNTYSDYDKEIVVSYLYNSKETLLTKQNEYYILPLDVFAQNGIIMIAVRLIKGNEIVVTKPIALKVEKAPNTNEIVPLTEDWQTLVKKYVDNITDTLTKAVICESESQYESMTHLNNVLYFIKED